eukprot:CAMPEP_0175511750 /NCGR_PEP_ID=MMETSP0096-20121207/12057_1 /TAXON_ID=311494 /ORGANISM="Alexandrium monilatum, Strain CCMP3105" /LENGTH=74 /DNA_ID=CAMNT_0016813951 /DNA_START=158 /DNA_END=380 /DNA_ORIENTATION=-
MARTTGDLSAANITRRGQGGSGSHMHMRARARADGSHANKRVKKWRSRKLGRPAAPQPGYASTQRTIKPAACMC